MPSGPPRSPTSDGPGLADDEPWGDYVVEVEFAGLQYRVMGLAQEHCDPITIRFGGYRSGADPRVTVPIHAGYRSFEERPVRDYIDPVVGYAPRVSRFDGRLSVEGLGFRGDIFFEPEMHGRLLTRTAHQLGQSLVFENYLRIVSAYSALQVGGAMMHSSAVVVGERSFLFIGHSGAGKTTLSRMALAAGAAVLSDDGNLLLPDPDGVLRAGPVPFAGELGQVARNDIGPQPVAGVFWLHKGDRVQISPMNRAVAYSRILACTPTVNVDPGCLDPLHDVIMRLLDQAPAMELSFARDSRFAEILRAIEGPGQ